MLLPGGLADAVRGRGEAVEAPGQGAPVGREAGGILPEEAGDGADG
jgi:hypothetical protein